MTKLKMLKCNYDEISDITNEELKLVEKINIYLDKNDVGTLLATLWVQPSKYSNSGDIIEYSFSREEKYASLKEFSTLSMKELLVLFSKRKSIAEYPNDFKQDDPKLHSFLSKLSYMSIEFVSKNIKEFSRQFKDNNLTLKIPRPKTAKPITKPEVKAAVKSNVTITTL